MKTKITSNRIKPVLLLAALAGLALSTAQAQTSGTWTNLVTGGLWSATTNWLNGSVADGSGATADFSTLDITNNQTVHLDASHTLTTLLFGDTATNTPASWTLDDNTNAGVNVLTLAGAGAGVTVNPLGGTSTATISALITGTDGLTKTGNGILVLSGANTYSGEVMVSGGTLRAGNALAYGAAGNTIVVTNGGTLDGNGNNFIPQGYNISIAGDGVGGNGALMGGNICGFTLTANATIGGPTRWDMNFYPNGSPSMVNGNGFDLTVYSTGGQVSLDPTWGGTNIVGSMVTGVRNININSGILSIDHYITVDDLNPGFIYVNTNCILSLGNWGGVVTINKTIALNGGTLRTDYTGGNGNAAVAANIALNAGGVNTIFAQATSVLTLDGAITNGTANSVTFSGTGGTVVLNAANTYDGPTTINNCTVVLNGGAGQLGSGNYAANITNNGVLQFYSLAPQTLSGVISGTGSLTNSPYAATVLLSGVNTYSGQTAVAANSTLQLGTNNAISSASSGLLLNGTLDMNGFSNVVNNLTGAGIITSSSGGTPLLTLSNNASITVGVSIQSTVALAKFGAGTLNLLPGSSYTGGTTVAAGALVVDASQGGAGNFLVDGGATLIVTNPGTLAVNSLTLGSSGVGATNILTFGNATYPGTPVISCSGTLTLSGVNVIAVGGNPPYFSVGQYPLIKYTTGPILGGGSIASTAANLPFGVSGYISNNVANSSIDLVVTGGPQPLTWMGYVNGNWDTATTNWYNTGTSQSNRFIAAATVTLDDTATGTTALTLVGPLNPSTVLVNNSSSNYSLAGSGSLTGAMSLTKTGTGTLTVGASSSYTGGTAIGGGTVIVSGTGNLGNGPVSFFGGALDLGGGSLTVASDVLVTNPPASGANTITNGNLTAASYQFLNAAGTNIVSANLGGAATFTTAAGGTVILTGNNTYGNTTNYGIVQIGNGGTSGTLGNGIFYDKSGDTGLQFNRTDPVSAPFVVTNSISRSGGFAATYNMVFNSGAVQLAGTGDNPYGSGHVMGGATVICGKTGAVGNKSFGGNVLVESNAVLQLAGTSGDQLGNSYPVTITNGGVFDLNGRSETISTNYIAGSGINNSGALINSNNATTSVLTCAVVLEGDTVIGGPGSIALPSVVSGGYALTKIGAGALTLSGANTYTGTTTVNAGALTVSSLQNGQGNVTVNDGTYFGVTFNAGNTLTNGTLTLGSVNGATNGFNLNVAPGANPTNPLVQVTTLVLNGTSSMAVSGTGMTNGQFTLIKYTTLTTNIAGGSIASTPLSLPPGLFGYISNNTLNASIDLVVTSNSYILYPTINFTAKAYTGPGADSGGVNSEIWNTFNNKNIKTGNTDAYGNASSVTFIDASGGYYSPGGAPIGLFNGYSYAPTTGVASEIISNVPPGLYDLYIYTLAGVGQNRPGDFTVNGAAGFALASAGSSASFQLGVNYTKLRVANTTGKITISYSRFNGVEVDFNGAQLVHLGPLPPMAAYTNNLTGSWSASGSWAAGGPAAGGAATNTIQFSPGAADTSTNDLAGVFALNSLTLTTPYAVTNYGGALAFTNNNGIWPTIINANTNALVLNYSTISASDNLTLGNLSSGTLAINASVTPAAGLVLNNWGTNGNLVFNSPVALMDTNLVFNGPNAGAITINSPINLTTNYTFTSTSAGTVTLNGTISGPWSFACSTVNGGYLTLAGTNTYTGQSIFNVANVNYTTLANAGSPCALGAPTGTNATIVLMPGGGNFVFTGTNGFTDRVIDARNYSSQISAKNASPSVLTLAGGVTNSVASTGVTTIFSGTSIANNNIVVSGPINIGNNTVQVYNSVTLTLNNDNSSFSGALNIGGGKAIVSSINSAPGVNSASGSGTNFIYSNTGSTLVYANNVNQSAGVTTSRTNQITAGVGFSAIIDQSGTGLLKFTSDLMNLGSAGVANAHTITFQGSTAGTGEFAGKLVDATAGTTTSLSVVKAGTGTWTLSGANTYSGTTAVNGGTLLINGNSSATTNTFTVAAGAFLGGSGTIGGTVLLNATAGLVPGGRNVIGTLTLTNKLSLNGSGLVFDLSTNTVTPTSDKVVVGNVLTNNGVNTIVLSFPNGPAPAGTYTLMTFASQTGTGSFVLAEAYPNATLNVTPTSVTLTVTGSGTSSGLAAGTKAWTGTVSTAWDATTANWNNGLAATNYADGDTVLFDDSASSFTVSNAVTVSPGAVTVNNSAFNYTMSGAAIAGGTALTKNGAATLTFSSITNTYTGPTTIGAGTLTIGTGGVLGNGNYAGNTTNNGTLNYANNIAQTNSGVISGTGLFACNSSGYLTLAGTNTYTGQSIFNGASVNFTTLANAGSPCALGAPTGTNATIVLTNGGNFVFTGTNGTSDRLIDVQNFTGQISAKNSSPSRLTLTGGITNSVVGSGTQVIFSGTTIANNNIVESGPVNIGNNQVQVFNSVTLTLNNDTNSFSGPLNMGGGKAIVSSINSAPGVNSASGSGTNFIYSNSGSTLVYTCLLYTSPSPRD